MQQHFFFPGLLFILSIIKFIRLHYMSLVLKNHHAPEKQCCSAFCLSVVFFFFLITLLHILYNYYSNYNGMLYKAVLDRYFTTKNQKK